MVHTGINLASQPPPDPLLNQGGELLRTFSCAAARRMIVEPAVEIHPPAPGVWTFITPLPSLNVWRASSTIRSVSASDVPPWFLVPTPDDLRGTVQRSRPGVSDRKQQYRVEFKASARLAIDRTQQNQEGG